MARIAPESELRAIELAIEQHPEGAALNMLSNALPSQVRRTLQARLKRLVECGRIRREGDRKAAAILEQVGLGHRLHYKPFELSGGQQQRVAIARSLANDPTVILADEPTGNLDTVTGKAIVHLLKTINQERGVTVVCSTHDPKMLAESQRVCWMINGKLDRITSARDLDLTRMEADRAQD